MKLFFYNVILLLYLFFFFTVSILGDNVFLKDGTNFENVKTYVMSHEVNITFQDGSTKAIPKANIKDIRLLNVDWKDGKKESDVESLKKFAEEQKRINSILQDEIAKLKTAIDKKKSSNIQWGNVGRSMILPGWGQLHNENKTRGNVYLYTWLGMVAASAYSHQKYLSAKDDYKNTQFPMLIAMSYPFSSVNGSSSYFYTNTFSNLTDPMFFLLNKNYFDKRYHDVKEFGSTANALGAGAVLVWFVSVIDAMASDPISERAVKLNLDYKIVPTFNSIGRTVFEGYYNLSIDKRF